MSFVEKETRMITQRVHSEWYSWASSVYDKVSL